MSFQDTLMNIVTIEDCPFGQDFYDIRCAWCDGLVDESQGFDEANNDKISHENDHGIYSDPDTGELWLDLEDSHK